jgi:hypothetical protein
MLREQHLVGVVTAEGAANVCTPRLATAIEQAHQQQQFIGARDGAKMGSSHWGNCRAKAQVCVHEAEATANTAQHSANGVRARAAQQSTSKSSITFHFHSFTRRSQADGQHMKAQ